MIVILRILNNQTKKNLVKITRAGRFSSVTDRALFKVILGSAAFHALCHLTILIHRSVD